MWHLLKLKCALSPLHLSILSSTSVTFTFTTVPNLALTHTKQITVKTVEIKAFLHFCICGSGSLRCKNMRILRIPVGNTGFKNGPYEWSGFDRLSMYQAFRHNPLDPPFTTWGSSWRPHIALQQASFCTEYLFYQLGQVLWIHDVYPGSELFHPELVCTVRKYNHKNS